MFTRHRRRLPGVDQRRPHHAAPRAHRIRSQGSPPTWEPRSPDPLVPDAFLPPGPDGRPRRRRQGTHRDPRGPARVGRGCRLWGRTTSAAPARAFGHDGTSRFERVAAPWLVLEIAQGTGPGRRPEVRVGGCGRPATTVHRRMTAGPAHTEAPTHHRHRHPYASPSQHSPQLTNHQVADLAEPTLTASHCNCSSLTQNAASLATARRTADSSRIASHSIRSTAGQGPSPTATELRHHSLGRGPGAVRGRDSRPPV